MSKKSNQQYLQMRQDMIEGKIPRATQYYTHIKDVKKGEGDNVYVNVEINHTPPNYIASANPDGPSYYLTNTNNEVTDYNVSKNDFILAKASDFFASVVRFSIPLQATPLMVCRIVPNQPNPNLTPYSIGIRYNGVFKSVNLIYLPNNNPFTPTPVQNDPNRQVITSYYYIYLYQIFINMINVALYTAYKQHNFTAGSTTPGSPILTGYIPPYLTLDPETNLISLIAPIHFSKLTAPLIEIPQIYINRSILSYFDNFNLYQVGDQSPIGYDFAFKLNQDVTITTPLASETYTFFPQNQQAYYPAGTIIPAPTTPPALPADPLYYKFTQEFGTLQYWASLNKIIIASNMPIKNEFLPAGNVGSVNINQSGSNVTFPILTDFIPTVDNTAGITRTIAYYVPQGQYRLVDLLSDTPLRNIDLRVFWQDGDGNTYPLEIPVFESLSVKLAFVRKSLYKGDPLLLE